MPDDNPDVLEAIASTAEDWRRRYRAEALDRLPCADCWQRLWCVVYGCGKALITHDT